MPVIAVAAAIGAGAIAAVDIAAVGLTAITAFEAVAAVGATLGAIGAITKDKTLSMVGLGLGALGGVGALATSAGLFGAEAAGGSSIFGSGPQAASSAADVGTAGGGFGGAEGLSAGIGSEVPAAAGGTFGVDAAVSDGTIPFLAGNAAVPTAETTAAPSDLTTLATTSENATDPALKLAQSNDASPLLNSGQAQLDKTMAGQFDPLQGGAPPAPPAGVDANGVSLAAPGKPLAAWQTPGTWTPGVNGAEGTFNVETPGIFGSLLDFAKKNPTVAMGVLKAGGSLIEGATNQLTPAQIDYYNAKAAEAQANAAMSNQQRNNLAAPKAVASVVPVTGAPQPLVPQMPGLINQPPRLAPVTGAPA